MSELTENEKKMLGCFIAFVVFVSIPFSMMLRGLVLSYLWSWFIVPWFGLPPLGVAQCICIALLIGMFTHQRVRCKDDREVFARLLDGMMNAFLGPLLVWLVAWIVRFFV